MTQMQLIPTQTTYEVFGG